MKPRTKGGSTSKRLTLGMKYKIQKKVREHNRKQNKADRLKGKSKLKKDPGVPRMHPFKEDILAKIEASKAAEEERRQMMRQQQRTQAANKKRDLASLAADAQRRSASFELMEAAESAGSGMGAPAGAEGVKDSSRRAFFKDFKKVVDAADVILEVLDARDPLGSRSALAEKTVLEAQGQKKLVLVLNKIDLVPREVAEQWLKYLRNELPTIAFKASTQQQRSHLSHAGDGLGASGGSAAQGAGVLISLLANYCRNLGIKTAIRVGIIGYPNVGKSSLINSLKRSRACGVGATPGFTRSVQEIVLDKHVKLLDSPGIVFSTKDDQASLVLRNCVRTESLEDPVAPVQEMLKRCNLAQIMEFYSVPAFSDAVTFLQFIARRLGKLKKGGVPDVSAAARVVLSDFNAGKVSYYTVPPKQYKPAVQIESAVVQEWGKMFDMDSLMREEADSVLPSLKPSVDYGLAVEMRSAKGRKAAAAAAAAAGGGAMDEDEQFITTTKAKKDAGAAAATVGGGKMTEEEALNPTTAKEHRRVAKETRRTKRKEESAAAPAMDAAEDEEDGGAYDFETDFVALKAAPAESEEEEEEEEEEDGDYDDDEAEGGMEGAEDDDEEL